MPKLIDSENVIAWLNVQIEKVQGGWLKDYGFPTNVIAALTDAKRFVKNLPKIEPEVRNGRWIEKPPYSDETVKGLEFQIVCSRCDEQNSSITFDENSVPTAKTFYRTRYCPNCGARMDAPLPEPPKEDDNG